ncbi:hypothetical protein ACFWG7_03765 [Streptomyces koyangensis]|uniref:Thioesterase domain-containing protein n=1 Tax=Streptomyces koyangensis TaxID=188770 RepID=A0A385DKM0_9ACTN|nr:hypothetical protein [Streptomyces koyangensis]AXQ58520.1 hypothetical protein D0C37_30550 [Streptomyces koyangensis]WTD01287.1 hypothetical protein OH717_01235 [Streptomyces albidoflavus]
MPGSDDAGPAWSPLVPGADGDVVLAVDFATTGRCEATFAELAGLLPGPVDVWQAVPPPDAPARGREDDWARHYLHWWAGQEAYGPAARPVRAVLGYCAGCVFASRLADVVERRQSARPVLVFFDPEVPGVVSLDRGIRAAVDGIDGLSDEERAGLRREIGRIRDAAGNNFDKAAEAFVALYREAYETVLTRMGVGGNFAEQLTRLFRSYAGYLSAARRLEPGAGWESAVSLLSAGRAGGRLGREIRFPVRQEDLLRDPGVARAVQELVSPP